MAEKSNQNGRLITVVCFVLMIVMIVAGLLNGAGKAYAKKYESVKNAWAGCNDAIQTRIETAYNLLTVAGRYMSKDAEAYAKVAGDLASMKEAGDKYTCVSAETFCTDANALLKTLQANEAVQKDSRDSMYATQMLPQAVEQCAGSSAVSAYNTAAEAYNKSLHSFSGFLAGIAGAANAQLFSEN